MLYFSLVDYELHYNNEAAYLIVPSFASFLLGSKFFVAFWVIGGEAVRWGYGRFFDTYQNKSTCPSAKCVLRR